MVIVEDDERANIVHYGSKKCRRITRSVMAAELPAMVTGLDQALVVKALVEELVGKALPSNVYMYSRTTLSCVAGNAPALEKSTQINVATVRESYAREEMRFVGWTPGAETLADGLPKTTLLKSDHLFRQLLFSSFLKTRPKGWEHKESLE